MPDNSETPGAGRRTGRHKPTTASICYDLQEYRDDVEEWKGVLGTVSGTGLDASLARAFKGACRKAVRSGRFPTLPRARCHLRIECAVAPREVSRGELWGAVERLLDRLLGQEGEPQELEEADQEGRFSLHGRLEPAGEDWSSEADEGRLQERMERHPVLNGLKRFEKRIQERHLPIVRDFRKFLRKQVEGLNLGHAENRRIAAMINTTLDQLQVALVCPLAGCGRPALLCSKKPGRSKSGVIYYQHNVPSEQDPSKQRQVHHRGRPGFEDLQLVWADGSPITEQELTSHL